MDDFIEVYDGALPADLCRQLIDRFEASPHVTAGETGGGVAARKKLSRDLYLSQHAEHADLVRAVHAAAAPRLLTYFEKYYFLLLGPFGVEFRDPATQQAVEVTEGNFAAVAKPQLPRLARRLLKPGPVQAQKYDRGQGGYFVWHSEVTPKPGRIDTLQRVLFVMFYLNDVADGGETEFFYQKRKVEPRQGRMLISPAYFTHTHRGNVPASGDKYVLTSWVLFNDAERVFANPA